MTEQNRAIPSAVQNIDQAVQMSPWLHDFMRMHDALKRVGQIVDMINARLTGLEGVVTTLIAQNSPKEEDVSPTPQEETPNA
jgi:xanthine dehydrogenase molybdopterin-binding subunit B